MTDALYVGIDISKESFTVASDPAGLKLTLPNTPQVGSRYSTACNPTRWP